MKMIILSSNLCSVLLLLAVIGCGINDIKYDDTLLDGNIVHDTSFSDPTFLLSTHPDLDDFDRETPVIICVHGYTACTFEWQEFRDFALNDGRVATSLVLLGGHGRSVDEFKESTWKDWQKPIMKEYDALVEEGFTKISLAGSSTGGTLIMEYMSRDLFKKKDILPDFFFLIDPIVVPASKLLHSVSIFGPILGNVPNELSSDVEKQHWYTNRPYETLSQLNVLCELVRGRLEKGIHLPEGTVAKCYKAKVDKSVDPISALLIKKGLRTYEGGYIDVELVDSEYHVFTQLATRTDADDRDRALQKQTYEEMVEWVVE